MSESSIVNKESSFHGIIIDLLASIVFGVTAIGASAFLEQFTPNSTVTYGLKLSTLILTIGLLFIRILNIPKPFRIVAAVVFTPLYVYVFDLITGAFSASISNRNVLIFIVALNFIYMVFTLQKPRKDKIKPDGLFFAVVINYLVYLSLTVMTYEEMKDKVDPSGLFINIFIAFLAYFIARQLSELEDGYYHSMKSSSMPMGEIRSHNYKTIVFVVLGFALALVVMYFVRLDFITDYIKYLFGSLLMFILKLLQKNEIIDEELGEYNMEPPSMEEAPADPWVNVLVTISLILIGIALLVFIVVYIKNYLANLKPEQKKIKSSTSEFVTDEIEHVVVKKKDRKVHDFGTGRERVIRKKFYSTVKKAIAHGVDIKTSDSPQQIAKSIKDASGNSIDDLTKEYEDIRYS